MGRLPLPHIPFDRFRSRDRWSPAPRTGHLPGRQLPGDLPHRNPPADRLAPSQHRARLEEPPEARADHLLYHLLDKGVSEYIPALEHLDDAVDAAQDEVFERPTTRTIQTIFQIKRSAVSLHRILGPQREVLNRLARDDYGQIAADHRVYFRDVYDHLVRIHDITESLRDLISGALDTYLSAISNRTNDIMKTLTLVTVMFMPMSFLAGCFGMNIFGESLEFKAWLPKDTLFAGVCLVTFVTPGAMWL
ncbi:MAG: CorA family divalent cation transporter [Singulisphaera sp.]